ncbi:MAG: hypothetical protein KME45_11440 [Stenomitos rutilans HA7619-LM2]|jgi:hypothetical protein|nr:hypothetical protein [Stenomitos rutilans HA7619-LM2]
MASKREDVSLRSLKFWVLHVLPTLPLLWLTLVAGLVARLSFWLYTDRVWEDSLITITHAVSAVSGLGLTHHYGEGRVHGFTSALSVLIPLAGEVIVPGAGLLMLRLASLLATVITITYAYLIAQKLNLNQWATFFAVSYLALSQYQIFYGMAGMETQVATAILLAGTYFVMEKQARLAGACLGLGLLVRPDFCLWVLPALLYFVWQNRKTGFQAALMTLVVASPWFLFATFYYGSPIPHTIAVKSLIWSSPPPSLLAGINAWLTWFSVQLTVVHAGSWKFFAPFVDAHFVLSTPIPQPILAAVAVLILSLALLGIWSTRKVRGLWVAIAYVVIFTIYYFAWVGNDYFSWYVIPFMALVVLFAAAGLHRLQRLSVAGSNLLAVTLAILFAVHIPFSFPIQAQVQQIENHVRKPLGEYLGQVVPHGEAVVSESAGYVGYYSRAKLYDFPGLTSPTALQALKQLPPEHRSLDAMINRLQPEWLVLRPIEFERLKKNYPTAAARCTVAKSFRTNVPQVSGRSTLTHWGLTVANGDTQFDVMSCKS